MKVNYLINSLYRQREAWYLKYQILLKKEADLETKLALYKCWYHIQTPEQKRGEELTAFVLTKTKRERRKYEEAYLKVDKVISKYRKKHRIRKTFLKILKIFRIKSIL